MWRPPRSASRLRPSRLQRTRRALRSVGLWLSPCLVLALGGCQSLKPLEGAALCDSIDGLFARKMSHVPLYMSSSEGCRAVSESEVDRWAGTAFTDDVCQNAVEYAGTSFQNFCENSLLSPTHIDFVGNPEAWQVLDPTATERKETPWSLTHATTLHVAALDQTRDQHRPYVKKVAYRQVGDCALGMQILKKDLAADHLRPVIFLHGGGWRYRGFGAVAGIGTVAPNLTEKDYIVFAPFYRLTGTSDAPPACHGADGADILDDVEAALQWVLDHGADYGMDPAARDGQVLSVVGQSAGGHLAAYLATYHPQRIQRAVLLYPATDLPFMIENLGPGGLYVDRFQESRKLLIDFFDQPGVTQAADLDPQDPLVQRNGFPVKIDPDPTSFPDMVLIQGDADTIVPVEMSTRMCEALDPAKPLSPDGYPGGDLETTCGEGSQMTLVAGADHILDLRCFTGRLNRVMEKIYPQAHQLCPSGSVEGERRVRDALVRAYEHF